MQNLGFSSQPRNEKKQRIAKYKSIEEEAKALGCVCVCVCFILLLGVENEKNVVNEGYI